MAGHRREARHDFEAFDANHDGMLDFEEFGILVREREPGEHLQTELRERFTELDEDGSGKVDAKEYICFSLIESLTHSRMRMIDLLDRMDSDRNRKISLTEFRRATKELGFDAHNEHIDLVFAALDEDGNGEVEYKELATKLRPSTVARNKHALRRVSRGRKSKVGHLVKLSSSSGVSVQEQLRKILDQNRVRVIDLFHDWDVDDDGSVTAAEFREAIRDLGYDASKADVEALFSFRDNKGSGRIDFRELHGALRIGARQLRAPAVRGGLPTGGGSPNNNKTTEPGTPTSDGGSHTNKPSAGAKGNIASRSPGMRHTPPPPPSGATQLEEWADLIEGTSHVSELRQKLIASERRIEALVEANRRLAAQNAELEEQLEGAVGERTNGVRQIASFARSIATLEKSLAERDATIEVLQTKMASEQTADVTVLREEKALMERENQLLAEKLYAGGGPSPYRSPSVPYVGDSSVNGSDVASLAAARPSRTSAERPRGGSCCSSTKAATVPKAAFGTVAPSDRNPGSARTFARVASTTLTSARLAAAMSSADELRQRREAMVSRSFNLGEMAE